MRFLGIDIASETHVVAAVDADGHVLLKPTPFVETRDGHNKLLSLLGSPEQTLVVLEATGHYWKNVVATLASAGFQFALINPLRTRRFAEEDLVRTKTDAIDALGLARFGAQKRPAPTPLTDEATDELRELVRFRDRTLQQLGDVVRQLHRLVDLGFPEFTRHVRTLDSELATSLLRAFPTAKAFASTTARKLAKLVYDGRHMVGEELAQALLISAKTSVGAHHGAAYRVQVQAACDDITTFRQRLRALDQDIHRTLDQHEIGTLLTTIDGIGPTTAARLIAELGDVASFTHASLGAYVGVVPGLKQSGKNRSMRAGLAPMGHAGLRQKLWMPTLTAVRKNEWLRAFYERLLARGKLPKVALVAAMHKLLGAVLSVAKNRRPFVAQLPVGQGVPA